MRWLTVPGILRGTTVSYGQISPDRDRRLPAIAAAVSRIELSAVYHKAQAGLGTKTKRSPP